MQTVIRNGVVFPADLPELLAELRLFLFAPKLQADPFWRPANALEPNVSKLPYSGGGRFEHAQNFARIAFPKTFEWHDWSERAVQAFCENQSFVAISGCGGSSKSTSAALYALQFCLAAPNDSAVLIASTSIDGAKRRIWKPLSAYYNELSRKCGGVGETFMLTSPRPCIRGSKKDTAHGIYIVPVAQGEEEKGINFLKGFHPKRLLVIGDEADSISQAVVDVCINLQIGTDEFQAIWLGNDPSVFNPLGKLMEPAIEGGWKSVVAQDPEDWMSTTGVKCLLFNGFKSPNLRDNDKWTGIMRQRDIDAILRQQGGNANTPMVWIMIRGLHPPDGVENTVLSESMFLRFHCRDSVTWKAKVITSALLDPAFGGDRCVIRKMERGEDIEGKMRLLFHPPVELTVNATDKINPAEYQIAQQAMTFCKAHNIAPEEFILDATGTGRGAAAVMQREWSPAIAVCEFGGSASNMIVSEENPKPAKDEYDRRITELYFAFREFVQADMIRGLDEPTAKEFCAREFTIKGTGAGKRTSVQSKTDLKSHGRPSPDLSDNAVLGVELVRRKGLFASIKTEAKIHAADRLEDVARQADFDSDENAYLTAPEDEVLFV